MTEAGYAARDSDRKRVMESIASDCRPHLNEQGLMPYAAVVDVVLRHRYKAMQAERDRRRNAEGYTRHRV